MKVAMAYVASFICFWLGHAVSRVFLRWDATSFLYPIYNRLMCWSFDIEVWAGIAFMWSEP